MADTRLEGALSLPFAEQLQFFRRKLNLPTDTWQDIWQEAHDRAFVVAGATKADLLADLREAVDKAIATGTTLETFRKDFRRIVAQRGWTGWTGEGSNAGEAWRTRVIYETNLRTSYAAGRYAQLTDPALLAERPYWRYVHNDSVLSPRPLHKRWGDMRLTLRHDHPFWRTHFPPNGWGCRCRVTAAVAPQAGDATEAPDGWNTAGGNGSLPGIDKGWAYAPGANSTRPLRELVEQKLLNLDAPIGAAMWAELQPAIAAEQRLALADMIDRVALAMQAGGEAALVSAVSPEVVTALAELGHPMQSADIWLRDTELLHALRDTKTNRQASLPLQVWRDLPRLLDAADVYYDAEDPALAYAIDVAGTVGKVLVRINYRDKVKDSQGKRSKVTSNFVRTGGVVEAGDLQQARYIKL
ncbi:hypothetical protein dqs_0619 [Azoarcus olearius]|uniref:phage head morphogenesis protein n=1 Tax=Azoarcus sp. (strain BH72) TaxID=418699 RepID=UPI0008061E23|nr:phage minor head protein [Azoarcus olearius]ANQ83695.1 hypothetical protein dqs_0619 [Azoarcus olearius]